MWIDVVLGTSPGIPTQPGIDHTESFVSLNTTTSNPSQYPPTAPHNAGDTSVSNLPKWYIPLSKLVTLQSLISPSVSPRSRRSRVEASGTGSRLVSVMVCVTSVEQPVLRRRKEERAKGKEGTLWVGRWEVIAPPLSGGFGGGVGTGTGEVGCEVKLWGSCARDWGDDRVCRGDIVLFESERVSSSSQILTLVRC